MNIFQPTVEPVPVGTDVQAVIDDPNGLPPHVVIIYHLGLPYPMGEQIALIHVGDLRLVMSKEDAKQHATQLDEKADELPKASAIQTASSMAEAERIAQDLQKFGGEG